MIYKPLMWALVAIFLASAVLAQHFNGSLLEQNYNLTKLMGVGVEGSDNPSAIDDPPLWIANWNEQLEDLGIVTFLYVFCGLLFLVIRRRPEVKDSEAALYAGFIGTLLGVLIFVIDIVAKPEYKLITWVQLLPMIVITAFSIILNMANRDY